MNKLNQGLLAAILMSVGFAAAAANVDMNKSPRHHGGNHHNMVYSVTEQTTKPNETLKKLANDTPKIEDGKRYMVKMSVVEVPDFKPAQPMPMPMPMPVPATAPAAK